MRDVLRRILRRPSRPSSVLDPRTLAVVNAAIERGDDQYYVWS